MTALYFVFACETLVAQESQVFVAPHGKDTNIGSPKSPFQTAQRAQEKVREIIASGRRGPITVFFAGGYYELEKPLVFDHRDSGSKDHPVVYSALPNATVTLSGGRKITGWKPGTSGHWEATFPQQKDSNWFFRQLVVNNRKATRARWPNENGGLRVATVNADVNEFTLDHPIGVIKPESQTEMVVFQNWSVTRGLVTSTENQRVRTATPMGWIGHGPATTTSKGKAVFFENALQYIDQPGEWFLDAKKRRVYYASLKSEDVPNADIIAPYLEQLVRIEGDVKNPVTNLHFRGLRFEHSRFDLPAIGYNEIQAGHYGSSQAAPTFVQPVAIECRFANSCTFRHCGFAYLNGSGIGIGEGCVSVRLEHCSIREVGGNGVMVGWRGKGKMAEDQVGKLDADWARSEHAPNHCAVTDCRIQRCGADSFGGTGIWVAFSRNTRIVHNTINDLPYTGISAGFRWNSNPSSQSNCLIESNHIFDVMGKLADGGGIYTLGYQPGTVIRKNFIHKVHRSGFAHGNAENNGIFFDQGSKGFLIEKNVIRKTSGEPIRFNQSKRLSHTWRVNYFGRLVSKLEPAMQIRESAGAKK